MDIIALLPHLNASLNGLAAVFLFLGFVFIRRGDKNSHRACMITAAAVSALFLVSYVTLRFYAPIFEFQGQGTVRIFYFTLLISHVALAICIVPLVGITLYRAARGRFDIHKKIARWTWPVWMYVSVTGIAVYIMVYQIFPAEVAQIQ